MLNDVCPLSENSCRFPASLRESSNHPGSARCLNTGHLPSVKTVHSLANPQISAQVFTLWAARKASALQRSQDFQLARSWRIAPPFHFLPPNFIILQRGPFFLPARLNVQPWNVPIPLPAEGRRKGPKDRTEAQTCATVRKSNKSCKCPCLFPRSDIIHFPCGDEIHTHWCLGL